MSIAAMRDFRRDRRSEFPTSIGSVQRFTERVLCVGLIFCFGFVSEMALAQGQPKRLHRQLMPFVEAPDVPIEYGNPTTKIVWLSDTLVAYTARKPGVPLSERLESRDGVSTTKYEVTDQVVIFDVSTRTSKKHSDGWLLDYEDGQMTIALREVRTVDFYRSFKPEGSYDLRLVGPIGQEKPQKFEMSSRPARLLKCPGDPGPDNTGANIILKKMQGCLYHPRTMSRRGEKWTYFRTDGTSFQIDAISTDYAPSKWVDWLGVYVMNTHPSQGAVQPGPDPRLILLWPDGRTQAFPNNIAFFAAFSMAHHVLPTRAGFISVAPGRDPPRSEDGVYVWGTDSAIQIADGIVTTVEVAPDGCKIAFVTRPSSLNNMAARLRVIDICKAIGVSKDANPFQ